MPIDISSKRHRRLLCITPRFIWGMHQNPHLQNSSGVHYHYRDLTGLKNGLGLLPQPPLCVGKLLRSFRLFFFSFFPQMNLGFMQSQHRWCWVIYPSLRIGMTMQFRENHSVAQPAFVKLSFVWRRCKKPFEPPSL